MYTVAKSATETKWSPGSQPKPLRPLTKKQAAFVKHLIENPKASATAAARATYNVTTDNSASQVATENLRKPQIMLELAKHSHTAELVLLEVLEQSRKEMMYADRDRAQWAVNARQTADSILDRIHGKSTVKVEQTSHAVVLNIDLTGVASQQN